MSYRELRVQQTRDGAIFADYDGIELPVHFGDRAAEYSAAYDGVAMHDRSASGRFWMRDRDRAALLHRLSTNHIERLEPGQGTQTVFTNHNGRIIDLVDVYALPDQLLVVTSPQQRDELFQLLKRNIFFNDRVKLEQANTTVGQIALYGPRSSTLLDNIMIPDSVELVPTSEVEHYTIYTAQVGDARAWIARTRPLGSGDSFELFVMREDLALVWGTLLQAGAQPMGQAAYDILRVEAGYGAFGRELSLDYIPLETGLWNAVSFNKGCYVGQEIIARMESRGRLAKKLYGLRLSALVTAPAQLTIDGQQAGNLTSVVESPRFGPIGLAYMRTKTTEAGATAEVADQGVTGDIVELPFSAA